MQAEIKIVFKNDIEANTGALLFQIFGNADKLKDCVKYTVLDKLPTTVSRIEFAKITDSSVRLFFREDVRVIKIHLENITDMNINGIKREISSVLSSMNILAKKIKTKISDVNIIIGTDEGDIASGKILGYWQRVKESLLKDMLSKVYTPISTFLATLGLWKMFVTSDGSHMLSYIPSAVNALSSVILIFIWAIFSSFSGGNSVKYSEV